MSVILFLYELRISFTAISQIVEMLMHICTTVISFAPFDGIG